MDLHHSSIPSKRSMNVIMPHRRIARCGMMRKHEISKKWYVCLVNQWPKEACGLKQKSLDDRHLILGLVSRSTWSFHNQGTKPLDVVTSHLCPCSYISSQLTFLVSFQWMDITFCVCAHSRATYILCISGTINVCSTESA